MNYTNFKVVIIDDNSLDKSTEVFYEHLLKSSLRLKNRVTIVRNLVQLGSTGNLYYRTNQFCEGTDIVIIMDLDDRFLGLQTLKIVNAFFQNPQTWISYSSPIIKYVDQIRAQWKPLVGTMNKAKIKNYRTANRYWISFPLRASRYALNVKTPLYHNIEYSLNKFTGCLEPTIY